jgi:ribose-phosphate pyrophosphokinase
MSTDDNVLVFAGETPESKQLAEQICEHMGVELSPCNIQRFNDEESQPQFGVSVSNRICVLVVALHQATRNSNDNLMVLFQMCEALSASCVKEIIILAPYTPMARQDKPDNNRSCIGSSLYAKLLRAACGLSQVRYITFDLHSGQIAGFFRGANIVNDNLHSEPHIISYIKLVMMKDMSITSKDIVVVAPDGGAAKRARRVASEDYGLNCGFAHMDKVRAGAGEIEAVGLVGDVTGLHAIIVDDMCDTGGTLCAAAEELVKRGAISVSVMVCHGVFSDKNGASAIKKLSDDPNINLVVTTNTCNKNYPLSKGIIVGEHNDITYHMIEDYDKFRIIDITWLAAQAVIRRVGKQSVSDLFKIMATSSKHLAYKQRLEYEKRIKQLVGSNVKGRRTPNLLEKAYRERQPVEDNDTVSIVSFSQ